MALDQRSYADIVEVRNVGRRRANIYLANGWTLLGWEMEQRIARRDGPPDEAGVPQPMHIKIAEIMYILGRPEDVPFEGDDIYQYERDENRRRRDEETERAAQAVDEGSAVEASASGAACVHDWVDDLPERRSCAKCGSPEPTPSVLQDTLDERFRPPVADTAQTTETIERSVES